jgi:hypothetical protein
VRGSIEKACRSLTLQVGKSCILRHIISVLAFHMDYLPLLPIRLHPIAIKVLVESTRLTVYFMILLLPSYTSFSPATRLFLAMLTPWSLMMASSGHKLTVRNPPCQYRRNKCPVSEQKGVELRRLASPMMLPYQGYCHGLTLRVLILTCDIPIYIVPR